MASPSVLICACSGRKVKGHWPDWLREGILPTNGWILRSGHMSFTSRWLRIVVRSPAPHTHGKGTTCLWVAARFLETVLRYFPTEGDW